MMPNHDAESDDSDARTAQTEAQVADEPAQPRRRSSSRVVHNASGAQPDVFVEGEAARDVQRGKRPTPDLSAYRGHERVTVANLEDDPADA
jgi:hypothetical protein